MKRQRDLLVPPTIFDPTGHSEWRKGGGMWAVGKLIECHG